jgi:hypothetical protein
MLRWCFWQWTNRFYPDILSLSTSPKEPEQGDFSEGGVRFRTKNLTLALK